ncbi:MAG: ATP-binding cassette domain-containing protein [Eubacteriales bacterium]|nr:ATP-binding cassette domain-containing protein [Eubacteriales bacterium]
MADIVLRNISKYYNDDAVIENFSYTFTEGRTYCIMGKSGIGKTTLLGIILGTQNADVGERIAEGAFSAVFQENRLIEGLTPVANVKMVLVEAAEADICSQLLEILPQNSLYKKCSQLSGGMKRRVAIVRAMMHSSDYIVMDEPFGGLDEESKKKTIEYIHRNLRGRTLIIVSHEQKDAKLLDAQICLLTRE